MRSFLAIIVLLNYMAVLLLANTGNQRNVPTAQNPYVHAAGCQEHNYLKLDCFDSCNPAFKTAQKAENNPAGQAKIVVTGFDFHYNVPFSQILHPVPFIIRKINFSAFIQAESFGFFQEILPPPEF